MVKRKKTLNRSSTTHPRLHSALGEIERRKRGEGNPKNGATFVIRFYRKS
jgi:hypothetical protein